MDSNLNRVYRSIILFAILSFAVQPSQITVAQTTSNGQTTQSATKTGKTRAEILTNDSIIDLVKAGIDEDVIIAKIKETKYNFDTSTDGIIALKKAGVTNRLLAFMMDPTKAPEPVKPVEAQKPFQQTPPTQVASKSPSSAQPSVADFPTEIGVYIKRDDKWVEVQPEVVNWKTGGILKNIASAGIVKGDVNGIINGAHSRNALRTPLGFVIVAPEGVAITEYQLIHLHEKQSTREFRTVTGGVLHASSGATRDLLQFEGTKVARKTFSVNLPTLGAGEYGFLPPEAMAGSGGTGASRIGKMYTFRVGE